MLLCFSVSVNAQVAKIGGTEYATIEAAFAAATEGQTITMLVDATPALSSQRAITKAAVIDLGGKTMTLTEDDLYFGTTTFKNGTIVVDPSVKPSTAVFWMFKNQTLTFDNVKIVATGVTGTYLIGLDGDNSDLNLLNGSEILVENTTALDLDIICINGTNTCDIKVENSKVNVTNIDGRVFFRGNYTVTDSEVNLAGITKAGFRIEAGQKLSIEGTSVVNIAGEPRDGGIHLTDLTATYTKAETATVNATVNEPKVAKVGENTYRTLALAVDAVEDGGTITLIANETFTKNNRYNNGVWWDGLGYSGDKSFTIDLADFTISQDGALNDYLMWFKNDGAKANTITLKNGTLDAGTSAYCALATASSNAQKITVNLENIQLINNNSDGATLKIRGGAELNANAGTIITGKNSYLGIEAAGKTTVVNIYEGAEIYQNGTSSYCGCLAGASGNSTINVYGGEGQSKSGGFIAMTSGGTINIEGGEWTANTDGTYANGNKSVLVAQSDKQYNAGAGNSIVNVTGGTFKGGYNCYGNAVGDAQINIKGGNFNANPTSYVAEGYFVVENNGVWTVERGLAGAGTEAEPYLINNVSDLKFFRDEVNKGVANKYNDPGVWVALGADIDLSGENWVGIGSATADHGFMGNFDGKNFTIKNLTITDPAVDTDGYAYAGLFGVTEGTDKDNQNTIKNLTIENVTITTTGHIAAAAVAYPYYTIIDNVKVCGDIKIQGGNYTAGVLAYTRRCVNASNLSIVGNGGSFVKGNITVGGVISDIQMNGGLTAVYQNFSAEGLTISGEKSVGGISGIISGQALDDATVKNVTLNSSDARTGIVAGALGIASTITNVTYENVTGAATLIGGGYDSAKAVAAKIGDTYYTTLEDALAAESNEVVELLVPYVVAKGETVTLDLNGKTISQEKECTASYEMINNKGNLTITGNGKLSFKDTSAGDPNFGWGSYTVRNEGTLVVENGTIEHLGAQAFGKHCIMALYQYCGSTTINGGTISTPNYRSARLWKGDLTINGGTFDGQVWVQAVDNTAKLTINGGTFEPNGDDASAVFVTNNQYDVQFAVTDGTFNGKVGCSDATKLAGAITGGKFSEAAKNGTNAALLATGLAFGATADAEGYYTVEDDPTTLYIASLDDLKAFRDAVNSGTNYYAGVNVYLAADIDMAGENWVGIGTATKDHGFMGNFDGQGYKIKNLTITNPALDSDGYAYAGLFGVTEGTDKDNQNTIKNLTIENVTITTTGHIAAAAVAYPYYTIIDNVKVCGDIKIQGGNYTAGVLAYTRRCVNASNLSIVGNEGSFVKGAQVVGGVISDIQMNGGLTADYKNFSADRVTVSGTKNVGGISGIIATQTLNGATVKNVTLNGQTGVGIVSGALGGTSTISNVTFENVAGATALLGATYDGKAIEAKIGDTYYATLENALAAKGNEVVELLVPYVVAKGETKTLDLNGKTVTGTPSEAKAYAVITNYGTLTISNGSVICNHTLAGSTGYAVNTITNCGTLTIEDATIENKSTAQYQIGYAIDNNSTSADAVVNIKGGKVIASGSLYYDGIRQFCNSQTKENSIVVSGGEVSTIWMQNPSDGATKNTKDVKGSIAISGGKVGVLSLEPSANFEAAVTGGHFGEISYFQTAEGRDLKGFITGGTFDNLIDETFLAMGYQLTGDSAPYTVAYTGKVTELVLVDGEVTEFVNEKEITVGTLTYKRSNIKNTWTPFYVPFAVPVSALADKFDVAYINDVRRTDSDDDGELDKFSMEIIYIHGGNANGSAKTLKANYPYFIRSKSGVAEMEITLTDAKVYAKENVFDCTTMTEKFEIKGNYHQIPSDKLTENDYVVGGGEWHPLADGYSLNPFRFYMTKSSRYEDEPAAPMLSMRIIVCGEEDENGATIIYDVVEDSLNNNGNDFIYDLQGRRVSEPKKGGIYIKNGKKILF